MVTSVTSGWGVDEDMVGVSLLLLVVVAMVVWCFVFKILFWKHEEVTSKVTHSNTEM